MKIVLTPKSPDRDFCKIIVDGFGKKSQEGISDIAVEELALEIQKILSKHYLKIEWFKENDVD